MTVRRGWSIARWSFGLTRLALAAFLVWVLATGAGTRLARLELSLLPPADYLAEARELREQGRYAEALIVCDAGLSAGSIDSAALAAERQATAAEQQSALRRVKDLARGAILGGGASDDPGAPEPSIELLVGAIATDLFVVGDVRDLIIQGGRWARGEKTDPVLAAIAAFGLVTTFAPQLDWAPSLLKAARRGGTMTERFAGFLKRAVAERDIAAIRRAVEGSADMARHASPAGAVRLLKHVDDAEDAARLGRFLARTGSSGADALRRTGDAGAELVKSAESLRAVGRADEAARIERVVLAAGARGAVNGAGARFLASGAARTLMRPHPLVGLAKSLWKGNAQAFAQRVIDALDPTAAWSLPAAAAWLFVELALTLRRAVPGFRAPRPARTVQIA